MCRAGGATTRISVKAMGLLTALLSINATARHQAAAAGNGRDGQRWANASSVTHGAKHAVAAVGVIMRRTLRPIGSAETRELIQAAQIICIQGERVTPEVARIQTWGLLRCSSTLQCFAEPAGKTADFELVFYTWCLVGRQTGNFPLHFQVWQTVDLAKVCSPAIPRRFIVNRRTRNLNVLFCRLLEPCPAFLQTLACKD